MAEGRQRYHTDAERLSLVRALEGSGHVILHDHHYYVTVDTPDGAEQRLEYGELIYTDTDPRPVSRDPDWRAAWQQASTVADRLRVLARMLGLES